MNKASRAIKVRLYPNTKQLCIIEKSFGCDRWAYNMVIAFKKKRWEEHGQHVSINELSKIITFFKKTDEYSWLKDVSRCVLQHSLSKVDRAYDNFFKGNGKYKYPRFKKKGRADSFVLTDTCKIVNGELFLPKIKHLPVKGLRLFSGDIKNVTITKNKSGQVFASWSIKDVEKLPKKEPNKIVGIDVNLENFLTDSDGSRVESPRFKKQTEEKVKYYQRRLAKSQPKSKTRLVWKLKIAKEFQKVENKKNDFIHKLSNYYVKNHDVIVIERLQIRNMAKMPTFTELIIQSGWGEYFRQLRYKGDWYGCDVIQVDPKNTSKTCSECGHINLGLTLKDRTWVCTSCNTFHIRDENSAVNIKGKGIVLKTKGEIGDAQLHELGNNLHAY